MAKKNGGTNMLTEYYCYCDKDTAFALQKLGYYSYIFYDDGMPAIHLWHAQKWLREEKDVLIIVCSYTYSVVDKIHTWTCEIWFGDNLEYEIHDFKSYEEALSEGIKEAVKILKE